MVDGRTARRSHSRKKGHLENRIREVIEMHLFDDGATEEKALCGADTSDDNRRSVKCYLEDRLHGAWGGTVCVGCKALAVPFAASLTQELEDESLLEEEEERRKLTVTISTETGQETAERLNEGSVIHV